MKGYAADEANVTTGMKCGSYDAELDNVAHNDAMDAWKHGNMGNCMGTAWGTHTGCGPSFS